MLRLRLSSWLRLHVSKLFYYYYYLVISLSATLVKYSLLIVCSILLFNNPAEAPLAAGEGT